MDISYKKEGKWSIASVSGRFDAQTSKDVDKQLMSHINLGDRYLALDLTNMNYMSSAGLRVLLSIRKVLKELKGNFVLVNPNENILEVLELSGFSRIFLILNDCEGLQKL
ncbi:MAG: STAS domain-containing protein [Vampirovibrionia bacterium]